jgi:hypothetical protein
MKKFIWGLQRHVGTLTPLTSSKLGKSDFYWGKAEEDAFNNIKCIMTLLPCLKNVDYKLDDPLWLFTDASGVSLRDNTVAQKASTVPFSYSSDHKLQFYILYVI